ncbi:ribonuclease p [Nannochloropsis oceanica]
MRVLPLISLFSLSSAFLLPTLPSSTSPLSSTRGRALASSASEELSRKEKSKEQVRSLLKGLGELDDGENSESTGSKRKEKREGLEAARRALSDKDSMKLEPEVVFFEGPPHWSEVVVPAISILTVIGIIPFASSVARQIWVKYKITSRRVSVTSGVGGKDLTEVIYADIERVNYVFRSFGTTGDMVLFLRDGAKVEMRSIPNFREVYTYIRDMLDEDAKAKTAVLPELK